MSKVSQRKVQQQTEALQLVEAIVSAFDVETKGQGGRNTSAIRSSGCRVFRTLAQRRGIFVRPVAFRRDEVCEDTGITSGTLARSMARLIEHGFLTVSGPRSAPMARLNLPSKAVAAYEREQERWAEEFGGRLEQSDLETVLSALDDFDYNDHVEHDRLARREALAEMVSERRKPGKHERGK